MWPGHPRSHLLRNISELGQFLKCPLCRSTKDVLKIGIIFGIRAANGKNKKEEKSHKNSHPKFRDRGWGGNFIVRIRLILILNSLFFLRTSVVGEREILEVESVTCPFKEHIKHPVLSGFKHTASQNLINN